MSKILLVRSRSELTDDITDMLHHHFGADIQFVDVEPMNEDELLQMVTDHAAVAVVLRENPLPRATIKSGIPVIPIRPGAGELVRLKSVEAITTPL